MEIKIGIDNVARELSVETDLSTADVETLVGKALSGELPILEVPDEKGGKVLVPSGKIAYLSIGEEHQRRVGFGSV